MVKDNCIFQLNLCCLAVFLWNQMSINHWKKTVVTDAFADRSWCCKNGYNSVIIRIIMQKQSRISALWPYCKCFWVYCDQNIGCIERKLYVLTAIPFRDLVYGRDWNHIFALWIANYCCCDVNFWKKIRKSFELIIACVTCYVASTRRFGCENSCTFI